MNIMILLNNSEKLCESGQKKACNSLTEKTDTKKILFLRLGMNNCKNFLWVRKHFLKINDYV